MKLMRIGEPGYERATVSADGASWFDATAVVDDIDPAFFAGDGPRRLRSALDAGTLRPVATDGVRIGPALGSPTSIVCIGMNYAAHAAESGSPPPDELVIFFKKTNTVCGPHEPIVPTDARSTIDWEVELGVVVGAPLHGRVSPAEAMSAVAGYVLADDLSDRWLQIERSGGQWSKGKSFPGSCALGPWIVTADEIADPQSLRMRSWVNGQPRQDSTTADMVFPVAQILTDLARVMALEPGDLILTGTPEGVALSGRFPYLSSGDTVRMTIDGLGEIEHTVALFPTEEVTA